VLVIKDEKLIEFYDNSKILKDNVLNKKTMSVANPAEFDDGQSQVEFEDQDKMSTFKDEG